MFLDLLKSRSTLQASSPSPSHDYWYQPITGMSHAGVPVTAHTAMKVSAVYACVKLLSELIGALPRKIYEYVEDDSRRVARDHPIARILSLQTNRLQTAMEYWETQIAYGALYGNSYAEIERARNGDVIGLWPIRPDYVTVDMLPGRRLRFKVRRPEQNYREEIFLQDEILRIPGFGFNGVEGIAPIAFANDPIGLAIATEAFGAKFFSNGAKPSVVLETDGTINEESAKRLRTSWRETHGGLQNAHSVAVLEQGLKAHVLSGGNDQNQFLETRQFQIAEIGRYFRIPQHMINDLSKSSFNNIEQQSLEFVKQTVNPWMVRIEQRINTDLLDDPKRYYMKHNVDSLLRGELKSRYESYSTGINAGFLTRNEVRKKEDLDPLEGLDEPVLQLNIGTPGNSDPEPTNDNKDD